jgi:hypothetical protein
MAEFKLGRIRFVWKGPWATSTAYYKDDVVSVGGKIYICVLGHDSAADFFTDLDIVPSKWNLVSDGQTWKGDWEPGVRYLYDDIVRYGARLYICQTVHESAADSTTGLEADLDKWKVFAEGLDWKGDWQPSFDYKVNDLVKYGGTTYVCNAAHISDADSANGLEADQANWDYFNQGIEYKSQWEQTTRYKVNDVVRYGASLWICTTHHTSTDELASDIDNWEKFVDGFQYEGDWDPTLQYQPGDIVQYGGYQYIALQDNIAEFPSTSTENWDLFTQGFTFLGDYEEDSSNQEYKVGEVVRLGGYTYICIQDHSNQQPPNTDYWQRLNTGLDWRGEWLDDQEYYLGDVVRYGDNSYICVLGHISEGDDYSTETLTDPGGGAENSRPDLDVTGTYWNIITVGTEQSVLTTTGDMVYYGGAGPTRLPIGLNGQVLQVNESGVPEWAFLGSSDDVYYVAEHGVDEPAPIYGKTLDRPWRSIRYAALQIDRGTKNPVAKRLLEINRRFIQREIVEWTDKQIVDGTSPFLTTFSYNSAKCERDMGIIVDALIWDITHGGNVKSREAALAYVNDTVGSPYLTQKEETVASINYGLEVIGNVLAQTDPDVNYQVTNGDNSTAVVDQWKDSSIIAEDGVLARITELVGIITDAITAGVDTNIPVREIRTTLIRVATGTYYEVLPISVPAECCVMGDELRATNVLPRKADNSTLTDRSDVEYSYLAVKRIEAIIGDIVTGGSVSATTGNNEVQYTDWPVAETTVVAPQAEKLARVIARQIDKRIGDKIEAIYTPAYDMSTPEDGYARDLNILNKEFMKAEITAYIDEEYPDIDYSRTKCKEDVGYIIDCVAYDLTYGGNWMSVEAGKAYFNGNTGVLQIDSTEKTATLAAYTYLKAMLQTIGRNIAVTPVYQTAVEQVERTNAGGVTQATTVGNLMDDIITTITDGFASAPTITYPTISNADANTAISALDAIVDDVSEEVIDFINKNFGSFRYNSATCRRDLRNILTDIAYDIALGTNYNAIFNGLAYNRPTNAYNLAEQRTETVGSIRYARDLVEAELSDATAITRNTAAFNEIVDIINNGTDEADTLSYPSPAALPTTNAQDAFDNLEANKAFIIEDVTGWIANEIADGPGSSGSAIWDGFTYDSTKCERDVGYIVEAMKYDILYGGTMATTRIAESYFGINGDAYPGNQTEQTSAAYDRLSTIIDLVVREQTVSPTYATVNVQQTLGSPATSTEGNALIAKMTIITDVLDAGNTDSMPAAVYPNLSSLSVSGTLQTEKSAIDTAQAQVILDTIQYISTTYDDFNYDHAKCSRDVGLILTAAEYDFGLGTNFASIIAAYSYLRAPSNNVLKDQKAASIAAFEYARTRFYDEVPVGAQYDFVRAGINDTWEWVDDMILSGNTEGGNVAVDDQEVWNAIRQIELNRDFIKAEVDAYIVDYNKDTVTATLATDDSITISDTSWLKLDMPVRFTSPAGDPTAVVDSNLIEDQDWYVVDIISSTKFSVSDSIGGSPRTPDTVGSTSFEVAYDYQYNTELCQRDVDEYLTAIQWDLTWPQQWKREYTDDITIYRPGCYKTVMAARYYANAVLGSQEEDFYYLRNNTGLRLQTLDGLQGDLTPANAYGTKRVTAGAYASLDPGWGPDDERVWITARSPYVQNLTTFGYAAVGQKIDGALHNGGNDSMVSNDFTQLISDGIGAWITNNGRAELVSVFTYYSQIGYLAENGGRVRATNGNNSYGAFGSVAEGVDPDEVPVTAIVDNKTQYSATASNVEVDQDQILVVEWNHAGNDYTEAVLEFFGPGDSEVQYIDEFRDEAVYRVRIDEINDSSGAAGGSGYLVVSNTAQAGSATSLTLAATDGNLSTAYPGMRVQITGGAGIGLYGIVNTYNAGSKIATVIRESDGNAGWDHIVPGTPFVAPNSSSTYQIEPMASFSAPSNSANTPGTMTATTAAFADIAFIETSGQYLDLSVTTDSDGTGVTFDVTRNGSKYYVDVNSAGTGYTRLDTVTISGADLGGATPANDIVLTITTVNSTTGAVVDFDFTGYGREGIFLAVPDDGAETFMESVDGTAFTNIGGIPTPSGDWTRIAHGLLNDGSSTFKESSAVIISDQKTVAYTTDGAETWSSTSLPAALTNGAFRIAFGNVIDTVAYRYVVISPNDTDVAYSDNGGASWTAVSAALSGTGFTALTYGAGKWVAIAGGTTTASYSEDGITWVDVTLPSTASATTDVVYGNGRFVCIGSATSTMMYSLDGVTWYDPEDSQGNALTRTLSSTPRRLAYGQGMFVLTSSDTNEVEYSQDGLVWDSISVPLISSQGYNAVAFGNPGRNPTFVATANDAQTFCAVGSIGATARGRVGVANEQIFEVRITEPGSGYTSAPTLTVTDPNNINDVLPVVRIGDGAIAQPTWVARGSGFTSAAAEIQDANSNGNADFFQNGSFIAVRRVTERPVAGSNVVFDSISDITYKLVSVVSFIGSNDGSYTCFLQVSPAMSIEDAPEDGDGVTMRIRYSQVRLTGHDFLDIGTGNFADTNYPNEIYGAPVNTPDQTKETTESNGGRVFFTATDQDGNFRVGDLFSIEQATGVATLNADAFNIAGLQELSLGEVTLGGNSASISEFSTDPFFTANSDTVVPTQRAIKAYIEAQIGGGGASLIVNSVTAGDIFIGTNQITTVSGEAINIKANVVFEGTVLGTPLAYNYFLR